MLLNIIDQKIIKEKIKNLGADLCGFAPVDRFDKAPKGFHPTDIYNKCKTVVVFARKLPKTTPYAFNSVTYSQVNKLVMNEVDKLSLKITRMFEDQNIGCVPIPTDEPYEYWEPENMHGRGILSLRHAAFLAGLGVLGKNNLLINEKYGNFFYLGAVLIDINLIGDPFANYEGCLSDCTICIESCPQNALDGITVNQKLCRAVSIIRTKKGHNLYSCNKCRIICPNALGIKKTS